MITRDECEALGQRIFKRLTVPYAQVVVRSQAVSASTFALGQSRTSSDDAMTEVELTVCTSRGGRLRVSSSRLDDPGLDALVKEAEAGADQQRSRFPPAAFSGPRAFPTSPGLVFESVLKAGAADSRATIIRAAVDGAEASKLVGAGDLRCEYRARAVMTNAGFFGYAAGTYAEFSMTARTPDGTGSGSAWSGFEDWTRVDPQDVIHRATDIAARSANAVAIEPGRYTVILEPAAVAALVEHVLPWWSAEMADDGISVFAADPLGTNKIGLQMMDRRLGLVSDPWDPDKPTEPFDRDGEPIAEKVSWFEHGVLQTLAYSPGYARQTERPAVIDPGGARLYAEGPTVSLDEMIASTSRGLLVHRLSNIAVMNQRTLLLSGTTRDGLFLIENGRLSKPVKNLRFTESPFFAFSRVEAVGVPVRASRLVVAPRMQLRDFNFTSLTNAI